MFWWFNGAFLGSIQVPVENVFQWWSWSDVPHYAVVDVLVLVSTWIVEDICLLDTEVKISMAVLAFGRVRIQCGSKEVHDANVGPWVTWVMNDVLGISRFLMVTVCSWSLILQKNLCVQSNKFRFVPVANDDASLPFTATFYCCKWRAGDECQVVRHECCCSRMQQSWRCFYRCYDSWVFGKKLISVWEKSLYSRT